MSTLDGPNYADNLAHLADQPHAVYIVWHHDTALYVGMTSNWDARTRQHMQAFDDRFPWRKTATHIDVWFCAESRYEAEVIERDTIWALDPLRNHRHSPSVERAKAEREAWAAELRERRRRRPVAESDPALWKRMCEAVDAMERPA